MPIEKCLQPALVGPFPDPANRDAFWRDFRAGMDVERLEKKYAVASLWRRALGKAKRGVKKVMGR